MLKEALETSVHYKFSEKYNLLSNNVLIICSDKSVNFIFGISILIKSLK